MANRDEIIASELATDPLTRGYSGMNDEQARDDMNTDYRVNAQGVWLSDAYQYLSHRNNNPGGGAWPILVMIKELAEAGTIQGTPTGTATDQTTGKNLMGFIEKAGDQGGQLIFMDFSQAAISLSWDLMVSLSIMSQSQRDELETLSNVPQSRGAELTVGTLTIADITRNR
jgi:hypothetical protein